MTRNVAMIPSGLAGIVLNMGCCPATCVIHSFVACVHWSAGERVPRFEEYVCCFGSILFCFTDSAAHVAGSIAGGVVAGVLGCPSTLFGKPKLCTKVDDFVRANQDKLYEASKRSFDLKPCLHSANVESLGYRW
jgi:hypothetical protein